MKTRVGVFGAHRGMSMIQVFLAYEEAELVAVCDWHRPSLDLVKEKADAAGIEVALYESFDDFIQHDMDAVVLANFATEHAPFAIRCLEKGLHVLSECVPCETMAQAVELIEAVEKSGKVYAFAENCCYMTHAFDMWQRYESGEMGEIMYAECEYLHDCAHAWPGLTYGDPNHWRNRMYATLYCTHSLGPILATTGKRPVQVVGYECPRRERDFEEMAVVYGPGIEMVTLENGAVVKSLHGPVAREHAYPWNYQMYCQNGMMESGRFYEQKLMHVYKEGEKLNKGSWDKYEPVTELARQYAVKATDMKAHAGADFYAPYFFIEKIKGRPDGRYSIDVYQGVDMGICGILAWKSACNGNIPIKVPNLRNPEERDAYRNDHACTTPAVAGDQLMPVTTFPHPPIPEEKYRELREKYLESEREQKEKK